MKQRSTIFKKYFVLIFLNLFSCKGNGDETGSNTLKENQEIKVFQKLPTIKTNKTPNLETEAVLHSQVKLNPENNDINYFCISENTRQKHSDSFNWKQKNLKIRIYFIRHGFSIGNESKLNAFKKDVGLSKLGINEALEVRNKIINREIKLPKFDLIISSVLKRAAQTAHILFNNNNNNSMIYVCPFLKEYSNPFSQNNRTKSNKIKKQKNYIGLNNLEFKFVTDPINPNLLSKDSKKSGLNFFLKFLHDNLEKLIPNINKRPENSTITIAVVGHSMNFKRWFGEKDKKLQKPNNLSIFKVKFNNSLTKKTLIFNNFEPFKSFKKDHRVIFEGFPKKK